MDSQPEEPTLPSRAATLAELRAPLDWFSPLFRARWLRRAPKGDGRPILLVPGYKVCEWSLRPLGWYLAYLGYDVYDWGLGRNHGDVEGDIDRLLRRVRDVSRSLGAPVTLIGWSLGGVIAREVARLAPDSVREVMTLGTPIVGGPRYTIFAQRFAREAGRDIADLEADVHRRNLAGIRQPVVSVYSPSDGIVGWRAAVDTYNAHARNIPIDGSHLGLGFNARVWRRIAELLAGDQQSG